MNEDLVKRLRRAARMCELGVRNFPMHGLLREAANAIEEYEKGRDDGQEDQGRDM